MRRVVWPQRPEVINSSIVVVVTLIFFVAFTFIVDSLVVQALRLITRSGLSMAKKWYVIHTYSGYENKVRTNLLHRIESMGMQDKIFDVKIPTETVTDIKEGGRRVTSEKKVFPGYILVQMELGDESWYVVRNTPGVTGFVGSQGKPVPLSRDEYNRIMKRTEAGPKAKTTTDFVEGMNVKVTSRSVRRVRRNDRRGQPRQGHRQGHGHHLRPGDPGRAGIRPGGASLDTETLGSMPRREWTRSFSRLGRST